VGVEGVAGSESLIVRRREEESVLGLVRNKGGKENIVHVRLQLGFV